MKKWYVLLVCIGFVSVTWSQDEAEECTPPSKKVQKLLTAARSSADIRVSVVKFKEAMEMAPDKAAVYFENGMWAYDKGVEAYNNNPDRSKGDANFKKAEAMLQKAIELCDDYHADAYYCLGTINYVQQDNPSAAKYFQQFVDYKHNDRDRYPEDYGKKLSDVQEVLGGLKEAASVETEEVPFQPHIVRNVSTGEDEFFPMISPDNYLMFFTRREKDTLDIRGRKFENFSVSRRFTFDSPFSKGTKEEEPFNNGEFRSYGAASLSVDNKEMIICACKDTVISNQKYVNCDLYSTTYMTSKNTRSGYKWTPLKNLGPNINGKSRWDAQPSLSSDGQTLYYTINGPNTRDNDIYVSNRNDDGSWGKSQPFHEINTNGKDKSPFLHQDSETLYFVSEVSKDRPGIGGLDIYYIRKENGAWTKPKNIGYPINTKDDELGLFVSIDGELAYYSSFQKGVWNIYSFELYEEARPQAMSILKGDLSDESGDPVEDATIEVMYEGSDEVTQVRVNGNDGKFATVVKKETPGDVMVSVKKEGHAFDSKVITKEELAVAKESVIKSNDLDVKKLEVGVPYEIHDIRYATASYTINDRTRFILKGFARFLRQNPTIKVAIHGHTDNEGNPQKNKVLSEKRANGVKDYLVSLGIDKSRLSARGFGQENPKVPNTSDANKAMNRRTEFVIEGL